MARIDELIEKRNIPDALTTVRGKKVKTVKDFEKRREEIKKILAEKEYGYIPAKPDHMSVELVSEDAGFCAGKAPLKKLNFKFVIDGKEFSFPVSAVIPKHEGKCPAFVMLNFRPDVPDKYLPSERIADRGYAVFSFYYKDVADDSNDFKSKCARYLCKNRRSKTAPGKIAMWAWAAMRVMDYIETLPEIDSENVAVVGHSRLGKTALVAGGYDERFKYVISNDSGCSGAAISRGKIGESIPRITTVFPYWFCPRYNEEAPNSDSFDFDQNFLTALTVPRHLMIGSAEADLWADPESEFMNAVVTNEAYAIYKMKGLVHNGEVPAPKTVLGEGDALYQFRHGTHFFSLEDWEEYMNFIDKYVKK